MTTFLRWFSSAFFFSSQSKRVDALPVLGFFESGNEGRELIFNYLTSFRRFTFLERFSDARNHFEACIKSGANFLANKRGSFVE
jgi:hypothetical protein